MISEVEYQTSADGKRGSVQSQLDLAVCSELQSENVGLGPASHG